MEKWLVSEHQGVFLSRAVGETLEVFRSAPHCVCHKWVFTLVTLRQKSLDAVSSSFHIDAASKLHLYFVGFDTCIKNRFGMIFLTHASKFCRRSVTNVETLIRSVLQRMQRAV